MKPVLKGDQRENRRLQPVLAALCLLAFLCLAPPCLSQAAPFRAEVTVVTKIVPDCLLTITVTDEPQLSGDFRVNAEGKVRFVLTDLDGKNEEEFFVAVKDKTADEAQTVVAEALTKYLRKPEVSLKIAKMPRIRVDVSGPVKTQGSIELPLRAHLSDALTLCACLSNADLARIMILRKDSSDAKNPDKRTGMMVDYQAFLSGESDNDPLLVSGDRIILTKKPEPRVSPVLNLIHINGEVGMDDIYFPMAPGMTVKEAFEKAGGLKASAERDKIKIVRLEDAKLNVLEINADKVEENDPLHNLPLKPGDLIIVNRKDQTRRFAVMGEVESPDTYEMIGKEKVTVLSALVRAGKPKKSADLGKVILSRGYLNNPTTAIPIYVDLNKIAQGKLPDFELDPGDALIVQKRQSKPTIWQQLLPLLFRFLPI